MARFYSLMVERDLFDTVRLVRSWGRIGTLGRERAQDFGTEVEARPALEALARAQRRRGPAGSCYGFGSQKASSWS
jgi:predicted DNA-binding WGR domain protein